MKPSLNLLLAFTLLMSVGCTSVSPWEKGALARPEMGITPDATEQRLSDHVYFSKEASSSGTAVSGAGCGCN